MKRLAPDLFDRRFDELVELGRARLPGLAPDWTDHNAHDPGITLIELLAWVTEAQLYSLGRMRRDERAAYAALFGLAARGTEPARGLVWPDHRDPRAPGASFARSVVIPVDAAVTMLETETPVFRPAARLLWVPGRVLRLEGVRAGGAGTDYAAMNARGGAPFQPFGAGAGRAAVLCMEFECRSHDGLFPARRADAQDALWPIGVRADKSLTGEGAAPLAADPEAPGASGLSVTLVTPAQRTALPVASDSSAGLLRSGALLLDLSQVVGSPKRFTLELRSIDGFERAPRLLRIEPNVLPIVQGSPVTDEVHESSGVPDWSFQLDIPGLRFAPGAPAVAIALRDPDTKLRSAWRPARLAESGPQDAVYEFDPATGRVAFGNGVNGRIPPARAQMLASYAVSDGERGTVAAHHRWQVQGFAGAFGVNADPISGGAAPTSWIDERREARRRARHEHALVSAEDIVAAALALPLLEVARAWVLPPIEKAPRTGVVTLVAMRARLAQEEGGDTPETARWLEGVRRRLAPRIPLATRLVVSAPRYRALSVRASVDVAAGRDPAVVLAAIEDALKRRLALTGEAPRPPGVPVNRRDVLAWIRAVDGVRGVAALRLAGASGQETKEIKLPPDGLPSFDLGASAFDLRRTAAGAAP